MLYHRVVFVFVHDFFAIKMVLTHNPEYNQTTWDAALEKINSINNDFAQEPAASYEQFAQHLEKIAQGICNVFALIKDDPSLQLSIGTFENEEFFNADKRTGLHIDLIFKPSDKTDINKFQNVFKEFAITANQNVELALDDLDSTIKMLFNEFYGNAQILIHDSHNDGD